MLYLQSSAAIQPRTDLPKLANYRRDKHRCSHFNEPSSAASNSAARPDVPIPIPFVIESITSAANSNCSDALLSRLYSLHRCIHRQSTLESNKNWERS